MTLSVSDNALNSLRATKIEPQIILEIAGVTTIFSAIEVLRIVRVGDAGLLIGNTWRVGGSVAIDNQENILSIEDSGELTVNQQLAPEKGSVSSVSSIQIGLLDESLIMSRLVSPGVVLDEILGVTATIWLGFKGGAFKEDFTPVFTGIIDEVEAGAGLVKINIAHPDQLKRQQIFSPVSVTVSGSLDSIQTTIPLIDASELPRPQLGPDGLYDDAIRFYIKVEDEVIRYESISGNSLLNCTRGALATMPTTHTVDDEAFVAQSIISIEDSAINVALKVMLSGMNGPWVEDISPTSFVTLGDGTTAANAIFFRGVDINRDYGVVIGDYITITGATDPANDCTLQVIQDIVETDSGTYAVVGGVTFVEEAETSAKVSFRSQYDTLGYGLAMPANLVDVAEHVYWHNYQLASFTYRFIIDEQINGKDFLDAEVYKPIGAFSIPRQGRASMGYHIGPVTRDDIKTLNKTNIKNPHQLRIKRSTNKNFYNTVVFNFDKLLGEDKFASGVLQYSENSRNRIKTGLKALTIKSAGLRRDLSGTSIAERAAERYLARYQLAAEYFENVDLTLGAGLTIEPGDPVMVDFTDLQVTNFNTGTRVKPTKLFSVINKKANFKSGAVSVSLIDANFDETEKYGVVAPSSLVVSGTTTEITIQDSFGSLYPGNEAKKWEDYVGQKIRVRKADWSASETVTLLKISEANRYVLVLDSSTPLSAPPVAGDVIEIDEYPTGTDANENSMYKAAHVFVCVGAGFVTELAANQIKMATPDVASVRAWDKVRVRNYNYTVYSDELSIESIVPDADPAYSIITFTEDMPAVGGNPPLLAIDAIRFPDRGDFYRFF